MLRQFFDNARSSLGQMTVTQKLLVGSLGVIALMTLFLVVQYSARPAMIGLVADDPNTDLVEVLRVGGIEARVDGGQVVVPASQRRRAIAQLQEAGRLPGDTQILFQNLVQFQDWKASKDQNRQQYRLALQNELARVIAQFGGVASATVIIDAPEPGGIGRTARKATASVTVFSRDGASMPQPTVDAIARLVAGAESALTPEQVQVIDGTTGRPRQATSRDEMVATTYLEHAQKIEQAKQAKLYDLLGYIPGVVVSVAAEVDVTRVHSSTQRYLPKGQGTESLLRSSTDRSETTTNAVRSAEPGVRSNQQADINAGGTSGTSAETSDSTADFEVMPGTEVREVVDPRGMPTRLAASVTVPQSFVEGLVVRSKARAGGEGAEPPAEPTEAEVQQRFEDLRPSIESMVRPLLAVVGDQGQMVPGEVTVVMVPTAGVAVGASQAGGGSGAFLASLGGGLGAVGGGGGGVVELVVVGTLALVAMAMMFMLVRRAGKRPSLPDARQLAGIPPALDSGVDIVGEAAETDTPMEGIELNDGAIHAQKMHEQVVELVSKDPRAAANLLSRWIQV